MVRRIRLIVFSLIPAVVLFLLLELVSFVYYRQHYLDDFMPIDISDSFHNPPALFEKRHTQAGDVLFSKYFPTRYYVSDRNYRGKTMELEKSADTYRVFSFGGSSTAGSPWGHEASFSRFLEDELNSLKRRGTNVEVVNLGAGSYGSTRALGLVKQSIQYSPDLIIIYAGHNEIYDNYIYLDAAKSVMGGKIRYYTDKLYTVRVARLFYKDYAQSPPPRVNLLESPIHGITEVIEEMRGFKDVYRRYFATQFEENLLAIIQTAQEQHVPVLLLSQPSHFFYAPTWFPKGDEHLNGLIEKLRAAYDKNEFKLAKKYALDILDIQDDNALANFHLGLIEKHFGNLTRAQQFFLLSIDLDEYPQRYTERHSEIQSELHDPAHGVYFVDVRKKFMEHLEDGLIDGRLIMDIVHPSVEGNKLITKTIMEEYFAANRVEPDLFDYTRYMPDNIWTYNIDPQFYHVICVRYFDIEDPEKCVNDMYAKFNSYSGNNPDKEIHSSVWEYLFYYGLRAGSSESFLKSASVYAGESLTTHLEKVE